MIPYGVLWLVAILALGLLGYLAWVGASVRAHLRQAAQQRNELRRAYQDVSSERDQFLQQLDLVTTYCRQLSAAPKRADVYQLLLQQCADLIGADPATTLLSLWRYDPTRYALACEAAVPEASSWLGLDRLSLKESPLAGALNDGKPVVLPQAPNLVDRLVRRPLSKTTGAVLLPITVEGQSHAILLIICQPEQLANFQRQMRAITLVLLQAALCIENLLHRELAMFDHLTRVYNFAYFQERLAQEIRRCHRFELSLSLLVIDVDQFKQINDTHGHQTGDWVLLTTVQIIKSAIRAVDLLARYGGDEFVVMLPETGGSADGKTPEAVAVAQRIRLAVARHDYRMGDQQIPVTVSIGISVHEPSNPETATPGSLFKEADEQLYRAKQAGRNRCALGGTPLLGPEEGC